MNEKRINIAATITTALTGLILLSWWFITNPVKGFIEHVPGMDNRPEGFIDMGASIEIGAYFESFDGIASNIKGSWSRFRGADFDNISKEKIKLADSWGSEGPPVLWSIELGEGHAGPIISDGKIFILDYDEQRRADILRCFSFDDGKEIWRRGYDIFIKRNHGMSRTVPATNGKVVVTIGPKCQVMCVDADNGDLKWGIDLEKEYGTEVPLWYTGQCPLIEDSLTIIAVGGNALITAFENETGNLVWEIPNRLNWKMSHSSIMSATIFDKKIFIYCAIGGVIGFSATGQVLFETNLFNHNVVAPSPVYVGNGMLFVTAGYGAGSMMLKLTEKADKLSVDSLQTIRPDKGIASEQQTPVFYKGYLFSILPKDAGTLRNQFVCYNPKDCTELIWSSGKTNRFGLGPYIAADDKFFILSDDGVLTMIKADNSDYKQLGQAKILEGKDAWGPMAIVKGMLLARDSERLVCVDLRAKFL